MNLNFKTQDFNVKMISSKPQKAKNNQNLVLTNHGVIWKILKMIKIHGQGMEIQFFVLRLQICIRGVALKIRTYF